MYPTIQSYDTNHVFRPPQQQQQQQQHGSSSYVPPAAPSTTTAAAANGPAGLSLQQPSSSFGGSSNFPTLRVHIAEPFRTAPPVRAALLAPPPPKPASSLSLDFERKVIDDLAAAGPPGGSSSAEDSRPDPYEVLLQRYMDMGYSREEVAMALTIVGEETDNADKVVESCKQYKELRSMGFKADIVVGALVLCKGDINAASDACITANMDA